MNPIPMAMEAATRAGSEVGKAYKDKTVKTVEPAPTIMWVLSPAGLNLISLSNPTSPLRAKDRISLRIISVSVTMKNVVDKLLFNVLSLAGWCVGCNPPFVLDGIQLNGLPAPRALLMGAYLPFHLAGRPFHRFHRASSTP